LRTLGRLRGGMKNRAIVRRLTVEVSLHDEADEAAHRQNKHRRSQGQCDCHDRRVTGRADRPQPQMKSRRPRFLQPASVQRAR
jgi:hypothetical protein